MSGHESVITGLNARENGVMFHDVVALIVMMRFDAYMTSIDNPPVVVLTPQQAADQLGCSKIHIYRLINGGALPSVDISAPGSQRTKTRILLEDLNGYVRSAQHRPNNAT